MKRPVLAQLINGFGYFEILAGLAALIVIYMLPEDAPKVTFALAALGGILIGLIHIALGFIMSALATIIVGQKSPLPADLPLRQIKETETTNRLLGQLLRAYGHDPEF